MHVWQGGEGGAEEGAGARERRPQTSGPFSPVRPRSRWRGQRGRRARGAGLTAAAREAGREEGGGAGREELPARPPPPLGSTPAGAAPPRDSDSARPALLGRTGTDGPRRRRRGRTRGPRPGAKCGRRAGPAARRGEWLRAPGWGTGCEGRGLPRTSAAEAGLGVAGLPEGGSASPTPKAVSGAVARRPAVRAPWGAGGDRGAPSAVGRRRGAAVAIQGLRAAAMQREEAGGGREGGGESQRRASQRAGAAPPGWHRGPERSGARGWKGTSAGACGPGLGGASRPGQGGPVGSHRWFLPKVLPHFCQEGAGAFWRVTVS